MLGSHESDTIKIELSAPVKDSSTHDEKSDKSGGSIAVEDVLSSHHDEVIVSAGASSSEHSQPSAGAHSVDHSAMDEVTKAVQTIEVPKDHH